MKTNKIIHFLLVLSLVFCLTSGRRQTTIFVIGDSTAAEKSHPDTNPERGWGMVLQGFFDDDILVSNHAVNGRSSKSFLDEGRWQKVLDRIKPGDYVFIQFGHNDEKPKPDRHTDPGTTFDAHLARYVTETREKGGIPVLFSCVVRRNFLSKVDSTTDDESLRNVTYSDEEINSDTLVDTHGAYKDAPRNVARKMNVVFIDANKITHDLEQSLGVVGSRKLHMWFKPGEIPSIPQGRKDNTHYNVYGAHVVAGLLAEAVGKQIKPLRKHVKHFDYIVSKRGRGNYMKLNDALEAIPEGLKTRIYVLDGQWTVTQHQLKNKKVKFTCYPGARIIHRN
ncbi:MAG: rhamnogalacturonan acetylesterase [Prevotella sp.]|nr:rhamnogalacturonan acetylesterase [Prevotella sp.]